MQHNRFSVLLCKCPCVKVFNKQVIVSLNQETGHGLKLEFKTKF